MDQPTATSVVGYRRQAERELNQFAQMLWTQMPIELHGFREKNHLFHNLETFIQFLAGTLFVKYAKTCSPNSPDASFAFEFIDNIDPRGIFTSFDTAINAFRKLENTWNWAVQVIVAPWLDVKLESPNKKVFFVTMYFKIDEHELDRQAAKHLQRG
ncbi:hypothetical protein A2533_00755 [Candidatus Falkowbacteria bacterium RIFOXYD2_FULL_35_9]|uniref:Uncharacterized protein n=1 Tax=Candidatus Falkowbacteria bacterium RIFOXYC2_FULL_36_12 TaxID=1798002 RepID=A0A1F5T339_9BACT|nr:MAG: hypothetical protein A2300_04375 [Candidatus Falkowbacteria bacterium RIFOXYB2_FULL_35_7]OGF33078.1 MAG: hypothetical protein A2223_05070 [Candidatus Falkowbacteria bacterium RIFOXYA2_FULL_35_8]OGF33360.1 MAG: hypothetical protein A2478_01510 [Candidatus Falkowbacteria bacterium RIFOXYC2_FULL_36_12]OGF45605.1 MAG: hypothetical protein A2533_00755 [Candidatus Falkowbacteria bacterium RIFOXYD2_FULL_35_9]